MAESPFTTELQSFISRHIRSVEQLEILCLLVESPGKSWLEQDIYQKIQSSPESVSANLRHLVEARLVGFDTKPVYRFSNENPELAHLAVELVRMYRLKRVAMIEFIYKQPPDPIHNFADAFKIRKDKS